MRDYVLSYLYSRNATQWPSLLYAQVFVIDNDINTAELFDTRTKI